MIKQKDTEFQIKKAFAGIKLEACRSAKGSDSSTAFDKKSRYIRLASMTTVPAANIRGLVWGKEICKAIRVLQKNAMRF